MERNITKRRRVFSPEPNTVLSTKFARNYMHHLVPALNKINQTKPGKDPKTSQSEQIKNVRHEVDMALALSAKQFAWSRFLRDKLQQDRESSCFDTHDSRLGNGLENHCNAERRENVVAVQGDDGGRKLMELRNLLPGGEEMSIEEMFCEMGSYIVCLESQMAVLRCLVDASV